MPKVCYFKPERKKERPFTLKDFQRIAKLVEGEDVSPEKLFAALLITFDQADEFYRIKHVYRGLRVLGTALAIYLAISRVRRIMLAVSRIATWIRDYLAEFPLLEEVFPLSDEILAIGRSVLGILGGIVAVIRAMLTYDSQFVDDVSAALAELGASDSLAAELDSALADLESEESEGE